VRIESSQITATIITSQTLTVQIITIRTMETAAEALINNNNHHRNNNINSHRNNDNNNNDRRHRYNFLHTHCEENHRTESDEESRGSNNHSVNSENSSRSERSNQSKNSESREGTYHPQPITLMPINQQTPKVLLIKKWAIILKWLLAYYTAQLRSARK
jgi:hypothetical protein